MSAQGPANWERGSRRKDDEYVGCESFWRLGGGEVDMGRTRSFRGRNLQRLIHN